MSNGSHPERCSTYYRCFNCWQEKKCRIYRLPWNELCISSKHIDQANDRWRLTAGTEILYSYQDETS